MVEHSYFLVFYPFAFSGVCSSELAQLETVAAEFGSRGVGIYGVSVDHKYALRAYAQQMSLSFGLLADFWPHGAVSKSFGCFDEQRGMSTRSTFLVSKGRVTAHFSTPTHQARELADYRLAIDGLGGGHSID
ncbi:peroxiredoxin [Paeniglutamicibacter cryotolerans]|uniref:Peroxiredoxin n=2 Tax=Paeniglutamicibacter cryotolerans TaxID=670079 RepID=A0A839QLP5_9MICC|nr:peroxiredoxin [Paeniglutamicibacter cryotolerans]